MICCARACASATILRASLPASNSSRLTIAGFLRTSARPASGERVPSSSPPVGPAPLMTLAIRFSRLRLVENKFVFEIPLRDLIALRHLLDAAQHAVLQPFGALLIGL